MNAVLTLHIGMPKCATTTIQQFLLENREWLGLQGVAYEMHPDDSTPGQGNASHLAALILHKKMSEATELLNYFLRDGSDVLLSSEMLFGTGRGDVFGQIIQAARQKNYHVRVIAYVRRQDIWVESDYKQHIKSKNPWVGSIEDLIARRMRMKPLDYHWALSNWARHVGLENMTVVPLNASQPRNHAIEKFLNLLDLSVPDVNLSPYNRNESPPTGLIEPARLLKKELFRQGCDEKQASDRLQEFFQEARDRIRIPPRRHLLSHARREELLEHYAESNARLADTFLDGVAAFEPLEAVEAEDEKTSLAEETIQVLSALVLADRPEAYEPPSESIVRKLRRHLPVSLF